MSDPRIWGYIHDGEFRPLPITPLLSLGKEPPFDVMLPDGRVRHVIAAPYLDVTPEPAD